MDPAQLFQAPPNGPLPTGGGRASWRQKPPSPNKCPLVSPVGPCPLSLARTSSPPASPPPQLILHPPPAVAQKEFREPQSCPHDPLIQSAVSSVHIKPTLLNPTFKAAHNPAPSFLSILAHTRQGAASACPLPPRSQGTRCLLLPLGKRVCWSPATVAGSQNEDPLQTLPPSCTLFPMPGWPPSIQRTLIFKVQLKRPTAVPAAE